jgi:integrase
MLVLCWYIPDTIRGDTNMLTDVKIRQRKIPGKISDGGGLYLHITDTGSKLWRQAYRFDGKQKLLSHGAYPEVSLAKARDKREAAKELLRTGVDPSTQRKVAKPAGNTFREVAGEVLDKWEREKRSEATLAKSRWLLTFASDIGDRPIGQITAPELLAVLRQVEGRGLYESAQRLRAICGSVFRYAIATGRAERDTAADLRGALTSPQVKHLAAITKPEKVGALLRAIDGYDGSHPATRMALQLAALTFVRSSELRGAEWSEFDMDKRTWTVPAHRMKGKGTQRVEHRVPLSRQAIAIIEDLRAVTGHHRWLFPSSHRPVERYMSNNTLNHALRRMGYDQSEMTCHGFRSTASTLLNEMGMDGDLIELQLAHQERNAVRRAYNRAERWPERVAMMQQYADYLDRLRTNP